MNEFQERLEELLLSANISRLKLSKILNISPTTINGYFNNGYYPQINFAIRLADYFNCSLDFLFGLSDNKSNTNSNPAPFFDNFEYLLCLNKIPIAKALRELKMSEYNYYRWKNGRFPKTVNLIEIAKYFSVSIDYLIGRTTKN